MNSHILNAARQEFIRKVLEHPFLKRCRTGAVTLNELKLFLVQQGLYSAYFTRFLCAMMANLPSNIEVTALAENLFEELGFSPDSEIPHYLLYRDMLSNFSLSLEESTPLKGTSELISTMFKYCRASDPAAGLGALFLGAEALVPALYSCIISGFEHCGVMSDHLRFFHIHTVCDDGHSKTLNDIMIRLANNDHSRIQVMIDAGQALIVARLGFFSSIDAMNIELEKRDSVLQ